MSASKDGGAGTPPSAPQIHLTDAALGTLRGILAEEDVPEEGGLRISARFGAGCSTPLRFDMIFEVESDPDDVVLEAAGLRIFVAPGDAWSLDGLRVDYVDSGAMGSGFTFQHPRGVGGRSC